MVLDDWLRRIENLHPVKWDLGLERVSEVGHRLEVIRPAPVTFLVGGTNGKGSTCAAIAALCRNAGLCVGVTTSPHLIRFNERITIDGTAASDAEICEAFERIETARGDISLTYFEFAALAAMDIFKRRKVDVAVLEVGLGGRLDAMNIVEPDVSVVTRIALDHQAWLGNDRESIAREKAGIMRPGKPCVIADDNPPDALLVCASSLDARPLIIDRDFGWRNDRLFVQPGGTELQAVRRPEQTPLPEQSLLAAVQAVVAAGILPTARGVSGVFGELRLAGRLQQWHEPRFTVLDVGHNPDAAIWLASRLENFKKGLCHAVVGMYRDKDYETVLGTLSPWVDRWYLCQADDPRAASGDELAVSIRRHGGSVAGNYGKVSIAYDQAVDDSTALDMILVFGSFPVVGGVLEHLGVQV